MLKNLLSKLRKKPKLTPVVEPIDAVTVGVNEPKPEYPEYLKYETQVVGYVNGYVQDFMYGNVLKTIPKQDSIIDFGSGRGDLYGQLLKEERNVSDYLGVEYNNLLADIGKSKFPLMDVRRDSWFNLRFEDKRDWAIAIASFDVSYSDEQSANPYEYLTRTIDFMMQYANKGIVLTFLRPDTMAAEGILTYDFSIIYFAIREYDFILDASSMPGTYKLIILKPYEY